MGGQALDIGCGEAKGGGLEELGYEVLAIDKAHTVPEFRFDAQSFDPQRPYDLILFSNVLWFFEDPLYQLKRYAQFIRPEGLLCFNVLTPNDDWVQQKKYPSSTEVEVRESLEREGLSLKFKCHYEYFGRTKSGNRKLWSVDCYVFVRELAGD